MPDALRVRLEVKQGLRARDGVIADLLFDAVHRFGAFTLSGGPRLAIADGAANSLEFGVSAGESVANGASSFRPSGGLRSAGFGVALGYDWSAAWRTVVFQRFDRLLSDAARSPITRRVGSPEQSTIGLGLHYSFRIDAFD